MVTALVVILAAVTLVYAISGLGKRKARTAGPPHFCEHGAFDVEVVGEASYQKTLAAIDAKICGEKIFQVSVEREPSNPYDPAAIVIKCDGWTCGYLPRAAAKQWGPAVKSVEASGHTVFCRARLSGGGPDRRYGIWLNLSAPESIKPPVPA